MNDALSICALCPRLCRPACPVATGTGREAAVPAVIAGVLSDWANGRVGDDLAREAATLCADCGACESHCEVNQPLPALLRSARAQLCEVPLPTLLPTIEGEGILVAIESDERPMAKALSEHLGEGVGRLFTDNRLSLGSRGHVQWSAHLNSTQALLKSRQVVIADGGVASVLHEAGVTYQWLHECVQGLDKGTGSCQAGGKAPSACCGGADPVKTAHPQDAQRMGHFWSTRLETSHVADSRCRAHLLQCGVQVEDPLDQFLRGTHSEPKKE
jgi:ferredoxin